MFVRAPNPIWSFVDLTGLELNDLYYAFFLENTFPYLPQPVYQDPAGTIPWPDPLQLLANGTLPDNLYFNPALVYRIEIRMGPTQDDLLIYEINNFVPPGGSSPTPDILLSSDNQVSNSQFAFVNFTNPLTITTAGTYNIAPDWFLVLTGTGAVSATITQVNTISGSQGIIGNPPYAIEFDLSGWSSAILYQQFNMNGALFASTATQSGAVTMSVTAESNDGVAWPLTLEYVPNVGAPQVVATGTATPGFYSVTAGAITLPPSSNTDISNDANVQMQIILPPKGDIIISNIQMIGENTPITLPFQQETIEQQQNALFHYYSNSIIIQPKDSILTGWNFSLNPFQFQTVTGTAIGATSFYIADQTILVQQNLATVSIISGQSGPQSNQALSLQANATSNIFALIQYIDPSTIRPYWGDNLSSLVRASIVSTVGTNIRFKMRLIYRTTLPATIGVSEPILSWSGVDPVFSAGWTAIAPPNDPIYTLGSSTFEDFSFNTIPIPISSNTNMTLGIVIYTLDNMVLTGSPIDTILFEKISLVPNDFAIDTNPMTWDESLRRCQFYYEKSHPNNILPGSSSQPNQLQALQFFNLISTNIVPYPTPFGFQFNTVKRAVPSTVNLYSPAVGTAGNVDINVFINGTLSLNTQQGVSPNWTLSQKGTKGVNYIPVPGATLTPIAFTGTPNVSADILFQFIADSRLGV
jgi:hypothetical protein